MPREKSKQDFLANASCALATCTVLSALAESSTSLDSSSRDDSSSGEDGDCEAIASVLSSAIQEIGPLRYVVERSNIEKSTEFTIKYFMNQPDAQFRMSVRTSKHGMGSVWHEIKDHAIFQNNSKCQQRHSLLQLAVALERLGSYGNGASVGRIARTYGIGEGTVVTYTKRVITAVRALRGKYIVWPNANPRRQISAVMSQEGFDGCVGFVDGTTIPLFQRPGVDGESYFDRKSRYSLNAQVVCDCDKRIIMTYTGCPGSMADSTVFGRTRVYEEPANFFSDGEYLVGDSAYGLSNNMITPYKSPATNIPDNQVFNYYLAKSRVRNEHTIGILKGRWSSLKELRIAINSREDAQHAVHWISACCILHNMLADLGDSWDEMTGLSERVDSHQIDYSIASHRSVGLRERIKENVLRMNSERRDRPTTQ